MSMKRKPSELSSGDQRYTRKLLLEALESAAQENGLHEFVDTLLTPSEQIMLGRRIWISRLLLANKSYDQIGQRLLVGMQTVRKVELKLQGLMPKYSETISKALKKESNRKRRERIRANPYGLTALKTKYPLHFLLFPWPK
jgi:Trp operon repressor